MAVPYTTLPEEYIEWRVSLPIVTCGSTALKWAATKVVKRECRSMLLTIIDSPSLQIENNMNTNLLLICKAVKQRGSWLQQTSKGRKLLHIEWKAQSLIVHTVPVCSSCQCVDNGQPIQLQFCTKQGKDKFTYCKNINKTDLYYMYMTTFRLDSWNVNTCPSFCQHEHVCRQRKANWCMLYYWMWLHEPMMQKPNQKIQIRHENKLLTCDQPSRNSRNTTNNMYNIFKYIVMI